MVVVVVVVREKRATNHCADAHGEKVGKGGSDKSCHRLWPSLRAREEGTATGAVAVVVEATPPPPTFFLRTATHSFSGVCLDCF